MAIKTKTMLIVLFVFLCCTVYAQEKLTGLNNVIKVAPLRTIDISNPGFEMAFEKRLFKIFSLQAGAAYLTEILSRLDVVNPNITNSNGYMYHAELRTYFKSGKYATWYVAPAYSKLKNSVNWVATFEKKTCNHYYESCTYKDSILLKRNWLTYSLKFGCQIYITRFVLDAYAGIGQRERETTHHNRIKPTDNLYTGFRLGTGSYNQGKSTLPTLVLGLKLGYNFQVKSKPNKNHRNKT